MTTRDLVLIALFAAIIVALGVVPPIMLPFNVPISARRSASCWPAWCSAPNGVPWRRCS